MPLELIEISAEGRPNGQVAGGDLVTSVCEATAELYGRVGFVPPWIGYLAIIDGEPVGTCSFKSRPVDQRVEIAYFTFPDHEDRGVATAMARQLIEIAMATDPAVMIMAQTLPEVNASTRVLQKLGFAHRGTVAHPEDGPVWEWQWSR